jgi:integrase
MAAAGLKPGTVTRRLALAAGFMRWCHKDKGLVDGNPLHGVSRPKVNDARSRVMSTDEVRYLMAGAQARDHRASWLPDALTILLRSAMRRGELHALTVGVVDFDECTAHLRAEQTKNGHARTVPLDPSALAALRRLADKATARGAILRERGRDAPASGNERLIPVAHANGITLAFMRALARAREAYETDCEAAGVAADPGFLRGLRLHDARHDAITKWAATGQLSVHELLMVSGHRDTKTLARYVNLAPSVLAGKLARVGATSASEVTHDRPRSLDVHAGSGADAAARRD